MFLLGKMEVEKLPLADQTSLSGVLARIISVVFLTDLDILLNNNTPHAFRQICAPWGVTFCREVQNALQ